MHRAWATAPRSFVRRGRIGYDAQGAEETSADERQLVALAVLPEIIEPSIVRRFRNSPAIPPVYVIHSLRCGGDLFDRR